MNRIEIKPSNIDYNMGVLHSELLVDGVRLAPQALVDLRYLAKSVQTSGNHDIFTCSCGCASCAGIHEPIFVQHLPDAIEWHFNTIDCFGGGEELDDAEYERLNRPGEFRFDPAEYQTAVEEGLQSTRTTIAEVRDMQSPRVDYSRKDIALLTTRMFSDRDHVKSRRCLAREFVVRASDGMFITTDGIPFSISELSLPPELTRLYGEFESAKCFPRSKQDVAKYELFLDKGRIFGMALHQHLDRPCAVKIWYRYGRVVKPEVWSVIEEIG